MVKQPTPVDISDAPELLKLAEEVRRSGEPRLLRRNHEDLAILSPVTSSAERRGRRTKTAPDREAFLSSAGGWKGNVDVDKFLEDNYDSRSRSSRTPVEL